MKTITRRELYNMIWSITKSKTAQELQIPLQYLSQLCKEHNIPSPSTQYWQQISWGQNVEKTPLPDSESDVLISLDYKSISKMRKPKTEPNGFSEILDRELQDAQEKEECETLKRKAMAGKFIIDFQKPEDSWLGNLDKAVKAFRVPEILKSRREIVLQTKAYFRLTRLSGYEQMQHPDYNKLKTHLNISVGPDSYDRALRIFDTIINIYEALGGKMRYDERQTFVRFGDVEISIGMSERNKRVELSDEERIYSSRYKFVPSGLLRVNLEVNCGRATVEETPFAKLEEKLDVIVERTLALRQDEIDRRERRRLWEIERRKREEERMREEERKRQLEILRQQERDDVRSMFNTLRRELLTSIIERVLNKYDSLDPTADDYEYIVKLQHLQDLIDPHRPLPDETNLAESDINLLASEFFSNSKKS